MVRKEMLNLLGMIQENKYKRLLIPNDFYKQRCAVRKLKLLQGENFSNNRFTESYFSEL